MKPFIIATTIFRASMALSFGVVSLFSTPAFAQNTCDAILRNGVFNLTTVDSQKSVLDNLFEWLKTTTWEKLSSAQNQGLKFGFPYKGVPIEISGTNSESDLKEFQSSL